MKKYEIKVSIDREYVEKCMGYALTDYEFETLLLDLDSEFQELYYSQVVHFYPMNDNLKSLVDDRQKWSSLESE